MVSSREYREKNTTAKIFDYFCPVKRDSASSTKKGLRYINEIAPNLPHNNAAPGTITQGNNTIPKDNNATPGTITQDNNTIPKDNNAAPRTKRIMAYKRIDQYDKETTDRLAGHIKEILRLIGEDPDREGLAKTPERVAKSLQFLTKGYWENGKQIILDATFDEKYQQMVIVKDIELYSMCEHHMLPFIGKCHVAYIPNGRITGLSKIARVVETYARRLQVQERLTVQIRDCIQEALNPLGVAVVIEANHTCMQLRGVEKSNSLTTTSAFSGAFLSSSRTRNEFLNLLK